MSNSTQISGSVKVHGQTEKRVPFVGLKFKSTPFIDHSANLLRNGYQSFDYTEMVKIPDETIGADGFIVNNFGSELAIVKWTATGEIESTISQSESADTSISNQRESSSETPKKGLLNFVVQHPFFAFVVGVSTIVAMIIAFLQFLKS